MKRMPGWISRADRDQVTLEGFATLADGREIAVSITNLSKEGCHVRSDETLQIGESIKLSVEVLDGLAGTVRWSLCGRAGVHFNDGDWT